MQVADGPAFAARSVCGSRCSGAVLSQDLDGDAGSVAGSLAEVDAGHAAGADGLQHAVLADEKSLVFSLEEQLGLEWREQAVGDEEVGEFLRQPGRPAAAANLADELRSRSSSMRPLLRTRSSRSLTVAGGGIQARIRRAMAVA